VSDVGTQRLGALAAAAVKRFLRAALGIVTH
jgi:hypothetical protein